MDRLEKLLVGHKEVLTFDEACDYIGMSYYKRVKAPTIAGHFNDILVHWNMETIKQDHGKGIYAARLGDYKAHFMNGFKLFGL